jgi:hypothetical protein
MTSFTSAKIQVFRRESETRQHETARLVKVIEK